MSEETYEVRRADLDYSLYADTVTPTTSQCHGCCINNMDSSYHKT